LARGRAIAGYVGREVGRIPLARTAEFLVRGWSTLARDVGRLESELSREKSYRQFVQEIIQSVNERRAGRTNTPNQH
jgi:hypothetical protein